jgi:hypothetical protein
MLILIVLIGCTSKEVLVINKPAVYGEMNLSNNVAATPIGDANVWENITNFGHENKFNNVDFSGGGLIPRVTGLYLAQHSESFFNGANAEFHITFSINGVQEDKCHARRKLIQTGDIVNSGSHCLLQLSSGDNVTLSIINVDNANDPTIEEANVILIWVRD